MGVECVIRGCYTDHKVNKTNMAKIRSSPLRAAAAVWHPGRPSDASPFELSHGKVQKVHSFSQVVLGLPKTGLLRPWSVTSGK